MKTYQSILVAAALALSHSLGCKPQPVVEQPPAEEPAVDINVNPNGAQPPATDATSTTPNDEKATVDVEVGGGQGVQVDINESAPQQ